MKIQLIDNSLEICKAWNLQFKRCEDVTIFHGDIFEKSCDCIISPANSFGFMDGGLDYLITEVVGFDVQNILQKRIKEEHNGELLVGQAVLVETGFSAIPFLISAPTMRAPMLLPKDSGNVYLASRAIFLLLKQNHHRIKTVTISGLATGVGQVPYDICAKQMKQAYDEVWLDKFVFPKTWHDAQVRHTSLFLDEHRDLQY